MHYSLSIPHPATRFVEIEFSIHQIQSDTLKLQLPSWRPGRYELGNFAKNIQRFEVMDANGKPLAFSKTSKDRWVVATNGCTTVMVRYNYYAAQADAGACWLDEQLLYINPVHCMLCVPERMDEECTVALHIPNNWKVGSGLSSSANTPSKVLPPSTHHQLYAANFHQLVDSPFMASPTLQHSSYEVNDIPFHIWIQGDCQPDWQRLIKDFKAFTQVQLQMMGTFPATDYHFLLLIVPYRFYHGVEHTNSTVLALGPGYQLMKPDLYNDLMGVASHELFHAWNVKTIRPATMLPYDYTQENYSRLGWVYEGFTTYYGDLFLALSGFFSVEEYFNEIDIRLQKHTDNYGRFNMSVADSSYDTWLDGYVPGIPNRKTSIYDEGSLIALMLDLFIRKNSKHQHSLDDVMRSLYSDFALKNKGYTEHDIKTLVEQFAKTSADELFNRFINGTETYQIYLQALLHEVGCYISESKAPLSYESRFGFKVIAEGAALKVGTIAPGSPAAIAGLSKDDELICINDFKVEHNLDDLMRAATTTEVCLEVFTQKKKRILVLKSTEESFYNRYKLEIIKDATDEQKSCFAKWAGELIINH